VTNFNRYYEKSIIEQAINQERSNMASHWEETKRSIRDARYRLSLSNNSDVLHLHQDSKHHKFNNEKARNGMSYEHHEEEEYHENYDRVPHHHDSNTSADSAAVSGPDKDDLYLDLINP